MGVGKRRHTKPPNNTSKHSHQCVLPTQAPQPRARDATLPLNTHVAPLQSVRSRARGSNKSSAPDQRTNPADTPLEHAFASLMQDTKAPAKTPARGPRHRLAPGRQWIDAPPVGDHKRKKPSGWPGIKRKRGRKLSPPCHVPARAGISKHTTHTRGTLRIVKPVLFKEDTNDHPASSSPESLPPPKDTGLLVQQPPRGPTVPLLPYVSVSGRQHRALVLPPPASGTGVLVPAIAPATHQNQRRGRGDPHVCPTTPTHSSEIQHRVHPGSSTADASEKSGTARSTGSRGVCQEQLTARHSSKKQGSKKPARGKENRCVAAVDVKALCAAEATSPSLCASPPAVLQPVVENIARQPRVPLLCLEPALAPDAVPTLGPDDQARLQELLSWGSQNAQLSPTSLPSAADILTTTTTVHDTPVPAATMQQPADASPNTLCAPTSEPSRPSSLQGWLCTMLNASNGTQALLMLDVLRAVRPEVLRTLHMDTTMPLLVEAAGKGDFTMVEALLQCGFDPNQYSETAGLSCLEAAAQHGCATCVGLLCDAGAALQSGPDLLAQPRKTPLMHAAAAGHVSVVQLLCQRQPSTIDALYQGHTALSMAADAGHLPVVELLLQHGARCYAQHGDTTHWVPTLQVAAAAGHDSIVRFLLTNGHDATFTALPTDVSQHASPPNTIGSCLPSPRTHLLRHSMAAAAAYGHVSSLQLLGQVLPASRTGVVLSLEPSHGMSPLEAAVVHDQLSALAYLMEELSPQLDLPRLLLLAQRSGAHHVAAYLQHRVQSMLLSASSLLNGGAVHTASSSCVADAALSDTPEPPSATPSSAARQASMATTCCSSASCADECAEQRPHHSCASPSMTSAALDEAMHCLNSLNIGAMPFVPASPVPASPREYAGEHAQRPAAVPIRRLRPWTNAPPRSSAPSPRLLPPLLATGWGVAVPPPRGLKYVPPHDVYVLACEPRQLQHAVHTRSVDVNSISNGVSAMGLACRECNGPAVCELLASGARAVELDSRMLLWLAEFCPHMLPLALAAGAEVVKKDATGNAALVTARTQSVRLYRIIIEACCSVPHAQDLFVMLATYGNYKAVTDMMDVGNLDINAPCSYGMLALLEATRNAHDAVVDRLLHNPTINLEVTYHKTYGQPRSDRHGSPTSPYSKIWTHTPEGMTALVLAASSFAVVPCKFAHIVMVLVDSGADVLAADSDGNTALELLIQAPNSGEVTKYMMQVLPVVLAHRLLLLLDADPSAAGAPFQVLHDAVLRVMSTTNATVNAAVLRMDAEYAECTTQQVLTYMLFALIKLPRLERTLHSMLMAAETLNLIPTLEWEGLLQTAAEADAADACNVLLRDGLHVNGFDKYGTTALTMVPMNKERSQSMRDTTVVVLEVAGADINARDTHTGRTALAHAARRGDVVLTNKLLAAHADVTIADDEGVTPLGHALYGMLDTVPAAPRCSSTPSHHQVLMRLLELGADKCALQAPDHNGVTPLALALQHGLLSQAAQLLRAGAHAHTAPPPAQQQPSPRPLLHVALLSKGPSGAVERVAEALLAAGADVNERDDSGGGCTPLCYAPCASVARLLLRHGADVGARDEEGLSALHWACIYGREDVVRVLLDAGAVDATDVHGWTALEYAKQQGAMGAAVLAKFAGGEGGGEGGGGN